MEYKVYRKLFQFHKGTIRTGDSVCVNNANTEISIP